MPLLRRGAGAVLCLALGAAPGGDLPAPQEPAPRALDVGGGGAGGARRTCLDTKTGGNMRHMLVDVHLHRRGGSSPGWTLESPQPENLWAEPRDASEGKGPQRRPQKPTDRRLEEVAKRSGAATVG